jgi:hypothetical protein
MSETGPGADVLPEQPEADAGAPGRAAHGHVPAALDDTETSSLVAVAWAATDLAAVERTLYPAVARTVPNGRRRVRRQLSCDRRPHLARRRRSAG